MGSRIALVIGSLVVGALAAGPAHAASGPPDWPSAESASSLAAKSRKGSLRVTITGLPSGTKAKVTVTGPKKFSEKLNRTTTLRKLRAGEYTVKAKAVGASTPAPKSKVVRVKGGKTAKATVRYSTAPTPGTPGTPGTPSTPGTPGTPSTPPAGPPPVSKGAIQQVNTDAAGNGGNAEAQSGTWSPDGTKVAFISRATNLVPGVTTDCEHVYLKTLSSGAIRVVDTTASNELGNGCNSASGVNSGLAFSPDGQWLLFCSASTNLIQNAPQGNSDVFGKNLATGEVEWFGPGCSRPAWSPDGTLIAYGTDYEFAGCGWQNNGNRDVIVIRRDSPLDKCEEFNRVSTNSDNEQPTWNGPMDSVRPVFSPDSKKIAFSTTSPFLVPNDTNVAEDVMVKDLETWTTTRVSTSTSGGQGAGASEFPAWSPDGSRIAFHSRANNLVVGDTNVEEDIFVKDLASGQLTLVSTKANGEPALFDHRSPSWSPDGKKLAWFSRAVDLVPPGLDINTRPDVYTKDLTTGFVQLVSSTPQGVQGDNWSSVFSIAPGAWSKDGTRVLFNSSSQNLSAADGNAFQEDIFVKTVG